ncbi:MAG: MFS transporter [Verrucomicrobiota bacterium]|nr:MFS transporter [Verrucomicrobiota bacterium]
MKADHGAFPTRLKTNLTARLDRLPWGRFHTVVTIALGLGWMLDAFETSIIGSVLGQVKQVWRLSTTQGSALVSSWVLGMAVGAVLFGYYSDRKGRKKMFIFTLVWYAAFSVVTALSWNFYSLLAFRFLAAVGVGGEYSAVTAAMVEFIPSKHRGKTSALILAGFPVGGMIAALAADFFLNHFSADVGWRLGFGVGALLAVVGVWVRYAIPESPRWLVMHGHAEEAERIVGSVENSVAAEKSLALKPVTATVNLGNERRGFIQQMRELFSRYRWRISLACALNFAQASVVYGIMPLLSLVILPHIHVAARQMPSFYFVGSLAALGGSLLAAVLLDSWGRKGTVFAGYTLAAAAMLALHYASTPMTVLLGFALVQFCLIGASNSAYVVTSEILPVRNRATGLGISVTAGRVGAFTAPFLLSHASSPGLATLALTVMMLPGPVAALLWCVKGIEGNRRSLEEVCNEVVAEPAGAAPAVAVSPVPD